MINSQTPNSVGYRKYTLNSSFDISTTSETPLPPIVTSKTPEPSISYKHSSYHQAIRNLSLISQGEKPKLYSPIYTRIKNSEIEKKKSVLDLDKSISKYITKQDFSNKSAKIIKIAENSIVDHKREEWLKRRNRIASGADSVSFTKFLKSLFEALDDDNSDTLEAKELITHLLAVGIAPEASYIEKALLASFFTDDISGIQMSKRQFMDLFKMDRRTDHILTLLNEYTHENLRKPVICELARIVANSALIKQASKDKLHYTPKITINETTSSILDVLYKSNTTEFKDESCHINAENRKLDLKYCSMVDSAKVIEEWWNRFAKDRENLVNINIVTQFLTDMKFTSNVHEARAFILSIKKPMKRNKISRDHFDRLFAKAVFKGALKNIAYGLSTGEFANDDTPLRMKLAMYQRRLMLSGMDLKHGESNKEGKQTLIALYNYTKFDGNEEPIEEIYKRMNTRTFRDERMKVANQIIQEKNSRNASAIYEYSKSYMNKLKESELPVIFIQSELHSDSRNSQIRNLGNIDKVEQNESFSMHRSKSNPKRTTYKILNRDVEYDKRLTLGIDNKKHSLSENKYKPKLNIRTKKFNYVLQANSAFKDVLNQL